MLDRFAEESILISEIESIADMDLRDIKCIYKDEDDQYETMLPNGNYIWDSVGAKYKSLQEILHDLEDGYTAIPF